MCGDCSTWRWMAESHFSCAGVGASQFFAQRSMSVRSQRMPPAGSEVFAGMVGPSSRIGRLRPSFR
jgi:hypothetical protein